MNLRIPHHKSRICSLLILTAILLVASYFRFTNLNWDEGKWIHPDEAHMRIILGAIRLPDDADQGLSLYFDTANSPLNCRNRGHRYSYGTLPLFLTRATAEWLDAGCANRSSSQDAASWPGINGLLSMLLVPADGDCRPGAFTGGWAALIGRFYSALADVGTIVLLYLIGRRLYGKRGFGRAVGLLAAALMAFSAFSVQQAHFFTVDSIACFFITSTVYFSVRASQGGHWLDFALAGLATGLATACKISAVFAAFLLVLAAASHFIQHSKRNTPYVLRLASCLFLAALLSFVAFRVAQPYAFEGPGFFGLRLSPEWFDRLKQIRAEQSGAVDLPSGRQWVDRAPILFPWINMVVWGMGIPLGVTAWAGWAVMGMELWRQRLSKPVHLIPWTWATVMFVYQGVGWVKAMRYFLPLYPLFVLMAAYVLVRLCRTSSRWRRSVGIGFTAAVVVGAALWTQAVFTIYQRPHTRLAASRWIYANVPPGSTLATEHWDWAPPLPLDGYDPYGNLYSGFEMSLYNEDTWDKRAQIFDWLDRADYIIIGSNRLYASIPRLPDRYPLTIAYYQALFAGELGFELAADFTSRPAIGPFQFPDQETPFPLAMPDENGTRPFIYQPEPIQIYLPPAEEAFSVYDHPRVLIFRKSAEYSRERVIAVLGDVDVSQAAHGQTPQQAVEASNMLKFEPEVWAEQQAGGTWSEMFNRDGLFNRYPALAAIAWWAVVTLLGWLTFPLLDTALPRLQDRGYGVARIMGLLIVAYLTWIAASVRVMPNTRGTIVRMTLLLALVGGGVGWYRRAELRRFLSRRRDVVLWVEGLFALLYLLWLGVRLVQPDLWHPIVGGEKPMDFAYLNAVMKSTWFPPYNPWFAGHYINYYYFGFVIVGTLTKLMGTTPAIAYNLAVPLLFALTGVGAFSAAYNLFGARTSSRYRARWRGSTLAGGMAMLFTVLLGNLGVVHLLRETLSQVGGEAFPSLIPGFSETVTALQGLWRVIVEGVPLPLRIESWYWHPTRIIPAETGNPIAEFPAFTFLYGDLHAHMIALPLTLLALVLIVYWWRASRPRWQSLILGALAIGALWPTNTWDYPTYLALGLVGLLAGVLWQRKGAPSSQPVRASVALTSAASLVILSLLFYWPYHHNYAAGYTSLERWTGGNTPVNIYLWIHALLLFPILTRMSIEIWRIVRTLASAGRETANTPQIEQSPIAHGLLLLVTLALTVFLYSIGCEVALVAVPIGVGASYLLVFPDTMGRARPTRHRLLWFIVGTAMALSLAVEIVVLKGDIGRQNTVFKCYMQIWVLLSIAAGVSVAWVRADCHPARARPWKSEWWTLWRIGMALLIGGGALFLLYGVRARAVDRMSEETGLTLDGMAFMANSVVWDGNPSRDSADQQHPQEIPLDGDYAAIRWLQDNVQGSPVIIEGLGYREYLWANRVSIYTGLPTVVGWRWHQVQQYTALPGSPVERRRNDVDTYYNTPDTGLALQIMARYDVRYVYLGPYERAYYTAVGLSKFNSMVQDEYLRIAYDKHGVTIYEIIPNAFSEMPEVTSKQMSE